MKGRRPKPKQLRFGEKDAAPKGRVPAPPKHLGPAAKAEWKRLAKELHADGRLTSASHSLFDLYCVTYGRRREIEDEISRLSREGNQAADIFTHKKPSGLTAISPLARLSRDLGLDLLKIASELGLGPVSVERVRLKPKPSNSPAEKFFRNDF